MLFQNRRIGRKTDAKKSLYRCLNVPHSVAALWLDIDCADLIYDEKANTLLIKPIKRKQAKKCNT
jgi:hypothetical protein